MTDRDLAQRDGIHPDISERYENSLESGRVSSAEEREAIAAWIDERAKDFEGLLVTQMELERLAREIREGAHHREG